VASEQRPVLASKFAPLMLSSSGAVVNEAQPDANQATASILIMIFMNCSLRSRWKNMGFRYNRIFPPSRCASIAGFGNCVTTVSVVPPTRLNGCAHR
jgi:hypothetical protein